MKLLKEMHELRFIRGLTFLIIFYRDVLAFVFLATDFNENHSTGLRGMRVRGEKIGSLWQFIMIGPWSEKHYSRNHSRNVT